MNHYATKSERLVVGRVIIGIATAALGASALLAADRVYWTDRQTGRIERAGLDGADRTVLLAAPWTHSAAGSTGPSKPRPMQTSW